MTTELLHLKGIPQVILHLREIEFNLTGERLAYARHAASHHGHKHVAALTHLVVVVQLGQDIVCEVESLGTLEACHEVRAYGLQDVLGVVNNLLLDIVVGFYSLESLE